MPMTPRCQSSPAITYPRRRRFGSGHSSTWRSASLRMLLLHRLAVAVQSLQLLGEPAGLGFVVREQELEGRARMAEPPGGVDAWREPEGDRACVHRRGVDAAGSHERPQAQLVRPREPLHARGHERAVLVDERDDVGDRGERDEVEVALQALHAECFQQFEDDARAAELRKGVVGRPRRDNRAVGKRLARPVMVGDDDLQPGRPRLGDLLHRRDPAVDGEDERTSLPGQARQRLTRNTVAFLEAAREMPPDLGAEASQGRHREGGGADAVHVVVPVDADPPTGGDRPPNLLAGGLDVAEQERIVAGRFRG